MCQPGRPGEVATRPGRLVVAGTAPQQRVQRVTLAGAVGVAAALGEDLQHLRAGEVRLVAEARRGRDVEVDVAGAVVETVRGTVLHQHQHLLGDVRDRLHRADVVGGWDDPQRLHVLPEQRRLPHRQDLPVLPVAFGPLQQRVVDVGDVLHVADLVAGVAPHPLHKVEGDHGGSVTEMGGVVRGDTADVHGGGAVRVARLHARARRVEQPQRLAPARQPRHLVPHPRLHARQPNQPSGDVMPPRE